MEQVSFVVGLVIKLYKVSVITVKTQSDNIPLLKAYWPARV
jgi:hypothetical protein